MANCRSKKIIKQHAIRVLVKHPGKPPEERRIENSVKGMQGALNGGSFERVFDPKLNKEGINLWCDEEGKLKGLAGNFHLYIGPLGRIGEMVVGPVLFTHAAADVGSDADLTDGQIEIINKWLKE